MKFIILAVLLSGIVFAIPEDTDMGDFIEVEILPMAGFTVVGMPCTCNDSLEVMSLWEAFVLRIDEIPGRAAEDDAYGVIISFDASSNEFTYLASVAPDMVDSIPYGMLSIDIHSGIYAVFTFSFDQLDSIYEFAYSEWLPESGYIHGDGYDFEFYPEDFIPSEEGVLMQLYMNIEEIEIPMPGLKS